MNRTKFANLSIRSKYFRIISAMFVVVVLTAAGLLLYINSEQHKLSRERELLQNKAQTINELAVTLNDVFFRARGYTALKNENELELAYEALAKLGTVLGDYSRLKLSPEEAQFRSDLQSFSIQYGNETLPQAVAFVQKDDYEGVRALSKAGNTEKVNNFLAYTKDYKVRADQLLSDMVRQAIRQSNMFTFAAFTLSALLLVLFTLIIWRILRTLVNPIIKLEAAAHSLAAGEAVLLGELHTQDEIGRLYGAFLNMARSIQDKEEELTMQNEELHAQQDELHDQQFRLERSLSEIESMMVALNQSSAVAILSPKGIFTYVNENLAQYTGYKAEEIVGHPYRLFELRNLASVQMEEMRRKLGTGMVWSEELLMDAKDGTPLWLHTTVMPYLNDEGAIYQYILIASNITSVKKVQQELAATLTRTEETKIMLERSNQLNHDITYTLDKQEFAGRFIDFMNGQFAFDSSLFLLAEGGIVAAKGIPPEIVERYLHEEGNMLYRMQTEKSYITERPATSLEQGISPVQLTAYDYYTSVVNAEDEILAIFCGTRVGASFSAEETNEIQGLMNRVALAIDRLYMVEEIEHARKLNLDIINNVAEGIQFIELDGTMGQMNKALSQMFQYAGWKEGNRLPLAVWLEHLLGQVKESGELRNFYTQAISAAFPDSGSMKYSLDRDSLKHMDVYAIPVFRREERFGTLFVHRDITREYELDQMKSELVSTVSHELRTPLSSVLGFTELLLNRTMKPEKQQKYLQTIHREAQRLTDLINDFLDLQRMESGTQQYSPEKLNLSELVLGVIEQYKLGSTHHILYEDEAEYSGVEADRNKLIQVLTNLLSNAIKFSPGRGEIKVKLRNEPGVITVEIQDNGLGIPPDQIGQLFQKFRRVDNSAAKRIGGTGLGLAICKEIIEKQNGTIGMESAEGEGTTVWFRLPVLQPEPAGQEEELLKWSSEKEEKPSVMIVEDDYSLSLLLSEELKGKGFRVMHHYHPQQAFEQALKTPFVAIIVDLMLGEELDGWDLIRMFKHDERTADVPIVISSALDQAGQALLENVRTYLTKPYPPGELSATLQEILNTSLSSGEVLFPKDPAGQPGIDRTHNFP
ncbi:ATP-binding protein [Paenibacillus tepidiphilus]|uniref:ATP-binding protein n=1 Tax=Paenibacillus tepidiphilus TaxID=2608683 RepID=UPI0012397A39|nr:ATP-binding protein [Paenibacillus tepidiphilus]